MDDQETARQIVHSFPPMQILYTDAGTSAHLINKIAAALAEARREERERCRESCEMALVVDADRAEVERLRQELIEQRLSESLAHESAKAHEAALAEAQREERERFQRHLQTAQGVFNNEMCVGNEVTDYISELEAAAIRALDGEGGW